MWRARNVFTHVVWRAVSIAVYIDMYNVGSSVHSQLSSTGVTRECQSTCLGHEWKTWEHVPREPRARMGRHCLFTCEWGASGAMIHARTSWSHYASLGWWNRITCDSTGHERILHYRLTFVVYTRRTSATRTQKKLAKRREPSTGVNSLY